MRPVRHGSASAVLILISRLCNAPAERQWPGPDPPITFVIKADITESQTEQGFPSSAVATWMISHCFHSANNRGAKDPSAGTGFSGFTVYI